MNLEKKRENYELTDYFKGIIHEYNMVIHDRTNNINKLILINKIREKARKIIFFLESNVEDETIPQYSVVRPHINPIKNLTKRDKYFQTQTNIFGYYGFYSELQNLDQILMSKPQIIYNVIIIANIYFDINGNIIGDTNYISLNVTNWKKSMDPWDRKKYVLVSIGGLLCNSPQRITSSNFQNIIENLYSLLINYDLDGFDLDFENHSSSGNNNTATIDSWIAIIKYFKKNGFIVTGSAHANLYDLGRRSKSNYNGTYLKIAPYLSCLNIKLYSPLCNQVDLKEFTETTLYNINNDATIGFIIPTDKITPPWNNLKKDMKYVVEQLQNYPQILNIGTWSIENDRDLHNWLFASSMIQIMPDKSI